MKANALQIQHVNKNTKCNEKTIKFKLKNKQWRWMQRWREEGECAVSFHFSCCRKTRKTRRREKKKINGEWDLTVRLDEDYACCFYYLTGRFPDETLDSSKRKKKTRRKKSKLLSLIFQRLDNPSLKAAAAAL